MRRSLGVTIVAVLLLMAGLVSLASGLAGMLGLTMRPPPTATSPSILYGALGFLGLGVACALWGVVTAIGLFRQRRWARLSLLIGAFGLADLGGGLLLRTVLFPAAIQQTLAPQAAWTVRRCMLVVSLVMGAIGGWWLYVFNQATVKAQFAGRTGSARPASITVIAVLWMCSGIVFFLFAVYRWPTEIFGLLLTGWPAMLMHLVYSGFAWSLSIGLLQLREFARKLAIGFGVYLIISMMLSVVLPGHEGRVAAFLAMFPRDLSTAVLSRSVGEQLFDAVNATSLWAIELWFLITRKPAFVTSDGTTPPAS